MLLIWSKIRNFPRIISVAVAWIDHIAGWAVPGGS